MANVLPPPTRTYQFTAQTSAVGDQVNKEFDTLYNSLNGALGDANIAGNANISGSKLAVASVPAAQHVPKSLTDAQIAVGGVGTSSLANGATVSHSLAPLAGKLFSTTSVNMYNTTALDVPGCTLTLTPSIDSLLMCVAVCDFVSSISNETYVGQIAIDGVVPPNEGQVIFTSTAQGGAALDRKTVSQPMALFLTGGVQHVIKLQVYKFSGTAGAFGTANQTHTGFTYMLIGANGTI